MTKASHLGLTLVNLMASDIKRIMAEVLSRVARSGFFSNQWMGVMTEPSFSCLKEVVGNILISPFLPQRTSDYIIQRLPYSWRLLCRPQSMVWTHSSSLPLEAVNEAPKQYDQGIEVVTGEQNEWSHYRRLHIDKAMIHVVGFLTPVGCWMVQKNGLFWICWCQLECVVSGQFRALREIGVGQEYHWS